MFIDKVHATIQKYSMLQKGDGVLVGLSGGPDSVALLHAIYNLREKYSLRIYIAHLNHKFRGEEAKGDRLFCESLAQRLKLEIFCDEIDVPQIAKDKGLSPEETGRIARYDFFKRTADKKNIKKLALGHNKDDQAETTIMRAIRGSGMAGLGGMSPVKNMSGLIVIRPLIEVSRREIEEFIRENNLRFRHDASNDELLFTRNRIRHELIPYLEEKFNPNIKEVLVNMAENLRMENEFLEKYAKRKLKSMSRGNGSGEIAIDIKKFKRQPEAIRKRILRSALLSLKGNLRRFTYRHWKEVEGLIESMPANSVVDLPGEINIVKKKNILILQKS